ncbi:MAG: DUF1998 domain-containing protein [Nitrososphaerota archaeon]|nr:DUF1998 domain-containing protein [Nitrososphaerota archaeon]
MVLKIRPSKLVMTFGPGSILDLPVRESLMIRDPSRWGESRRIDEIRLAAILGVDHFGEPVGGSDGHNRGTEGVPAIDFPRIRYCPECKMLQTNLYCQNHSGKGGTRDHKTMGPRLVAACPSGHIEDFPWKLWIHCDCAPGTERLFLVGGGAATESDLNLRCDTCGKHKDLQGATGWMNWARCRGQRPWVGDSETCSHALKGLMRGASNVYFPSLRSSLSIPPYSSPLHRVIEPYRNVAYANWQEGTIPDWIRVTTNLRRKLEDKTFTIEEMTQGFDEMYNVTRTQRIKDDEWRVLTNPSQTGPEDDFHARQLDIEGSHLRDWFESVTVVSRLREVMALRGFTRIKPEGHAVDGPDPQAPPLEVQVQTWQTCRSSVGDAEEAPGPELWMPGVELFGEGIFFEFSRGMAAQWSRSNDLRILPMLRSPRRPSRGAEVDLDDPRLVLVHSFAHLLIRELSLACGYSAASLRERLYVSRGSNSQPEMSGVLVYTSSSDSEGTLGGLVAQARNANALLEHVRRTVAASSICSQDPLCADHDPRPTHDPWGASCHACTQLPETSCEQLQNRLLDRLSIADPGTGYFA